MCTPGTERIKITDTATVDYSSCIDSTYTPCKDQLLSGGQKHCECSIVDFTLKSTLLKEVILFYQMDSFNETSVYNEANYALSRYFLLIINHTSLFNLR